MPNKQHLVRKIKHTKTIPYEQKKHTKKKIINVTGDNDINKSVFAPSCLHKKKLT